ncbi:hypothetical protein GGI23_002009, partial [Coemansia sp. RSA 2559]
KPGSNNTSAAANKQAKAEHCIRISISISIGIGIGGKRRACVYRVDPMELRAACVALKNNRGMQTRV